MAIDVYKSQMVVAEAPMGQRLTFRNEEEWIGQLVSRLVRSCRHLWWNTEGRGRPGVGLGVGELGEAGLPVAVGNPRQVRDFGQVV